MDRAGRNEGADGVALQDLDLALAAQAAGEFAGPGLGGDNAFRRRTGRVLQGRDHRVPAPQPLVGALFEAFAVAGPGRVSRPPLARAPPLITVVASPMARHYKTRSDFGSL